MTDHTADAPTRGTVQGRCALCKMDTPHKQSKSSREVYCLRCGQFNPGFETPDEAEFRTTVMLQVLLDCKDQEIVRLEDALHEARLVVEAEREACARLCDEVSEDYDPVTAKRCAELIRSAKPAN